MGYLKIMQPENSARGNKRVGKKGNKIYVRNNGNREKGNEKNGNRKTLGNGKLRGCKNVAKIKRLEKLMKNVSKT